MKAKHRLLKRIAIAFGAFFALLVLLAAILPFVVDVDQFRPKISEMAGQYIQGELKLGKLRLSLWGQIKIQVDGFSLNDSKGRNIVSVRDVYFHVPFSSVFAGAPLLTLAMNKPEVTLIKDAKGLNALTLVKATPAGQPTNAAPAAPAAPSGGEGSGSSLPGIVARARLGLSMTDAHISYVDRITDFSTAIEALNVRVKDLSLSRPTEIEVSANLNTRMGKVLSVTGPMVFRATAKPEFSGSEFQRASVHVLADLDKLQIQYGDLFHKTASVPMRAEGVIAATPTSAEIQKLVARFHNAEITVSGAYTGMGSEHPAVQFAAKSNDIAMGPWAALVPMLKAYELSGAAAFDASAKGPMDKLAYQAVFALKALKAKAPYIKGQPQIDAQVKVVTDKVEKMEMTMKAPGNDLRVSGSVVSFSKPKIAFRVDSTGMDLDQILDFPKAPKTAAAPAAPAPGDTKTASKGGAAAQSDYDALLEPLREAPIAAATTGSIVVAMKFIKMMNVRMEPIDASLTLKGLLASLDRFRMGMFDGMILANASFDLKPKMPRYDFGLDVAGLDLKKAVTSQMEMFKNTAYGKATFKMKGKGASFNPNPAKANLTGSGSFSIADAQFATMDIGKMAQEAVNRALEWAAKAVPGLAGKRLTLGNVQTGYERFSASFTIGSGVFTMPDFVAVSGHHKGIDLKGATTIGLLDYKLAAQWAIIDTHNLTGARNLSVETNGVRVDSILAEPGQPVQFPIKVGGTLFAPAPDYTSVAEALGKVALANAGRAVEAKLKQEVGNRAKAELQKVAPPALQNVIKGLKF